MYGGMHDIARFRDPVSKVEKLSHFILETKAISSVQNQSLWQISYKYFDHDICMCALSWQKIGYIIKRYLEI